MLNFDSLWEGLGLASLPNFECDFSRKIFLMLYSINWPNLIDSLPLILEILGNMCIVIICCPAYDVINFEINHSLLIQPFFYIAKKPGQKCKILKSEKSF